MKSQNKSQRQLQIGENIKRIMSEIFLRDDFSIMMNNVITILQADVSPDAKNVKIYLDILGDSSKHQQIFDKISLNAPHFRYKLAQKINLRTIPEIIFVLDKTMQKASELQALIDSESLQFLNQNIAEKINLTPRKSKNLSPKNIRVASKSRRKK